MSEMMTRFGYPIDRTMIGDQIPTNNESWMAFEAAPHHPLAGDGLVEVYLSKDYIVQVFSIPSEGGPRLTIRRIDGAEIVGRWDVLQEIKEAVCGVNARAVEVYPARRDLIDAFNMRHLWIIADDDRRPALDIGWRKRSNADG